MPPPRVPPELRHVPFTLAQAERAGLTVSALRSSPWRHIFRDVWVHRDVPDTRDFRLAAVRLVLPPYAVLCGLTAAWLHGVDVRREDDLDIHASFPKGKRPRNRTGLLVCQETLEPQDILLVEGVRVTTAVRTSFDCARWLRGVERMVVVDALAHAGLAPIAEVRSYAGTKRRLRNLRRAVLLLDQCDALAESPMESRLRFLLVNGGIAGIESQVEVYDERGRFIGRLDLAVRAAKLGIEYDGAFHWQQRREDDRRRTLLREQGWEVLVYSAEDYYQRRDAILAEVDRCVRRRLARLGSAPPQR